MIEIFEPGSDEERMALSLLGKAKEFHEKEGAHPMAFIFTPDNRLNILPLASIPHWGAAGALGGVAIELLRQLCHQMQAYFIAILNDSWNTRIDEAGAKAAGLDPYEYKSWAAWAVERFTRRREALLLGIESRAGYRFVRQFYRRAGRRIVWEEIDVKTGEDLDGGRALGLLPTEQRQ